MTNLTINEALSLKVSERLSAIEKLNVELVSIETVQATLKEKGISSDVVTNEYNRLIAEIAKASTFTTIVKVTINELGEPSYEIVNDSVKVKERATGITTAAHQLTVNGKLYNSSAEAMKEVFPDDYKPGEDSSFRIFRMAALGKCSVAKGEVVVEGGIVIAGDVASLGNDKITKLFIPKA